MWYFVAAYAPLGGKLTILPPDLLFLLLDATTFFLSTFCLALAPPLAPLAVTGALGSDAELVLV